MTIFDVEDNLAPSKSIVYWERSDSYGCERQPC